MLSLYDVERSGNCYKIRLFLSMLRQPYQTISVDIDSNEQRSVEFLRLSPRGQVPVLRDGDNVIWDSTAILVYLARKHGGDAWLPSDPLAMSRVVQWLVLEQNEGRYGLSRARAIRLRSRTEFARFGNMDEAQRLGRAALSTYEAQLQHSNWLASANDHPTIADIACYPYVVLSPEGGLDLAAYPSVRRWMCEVQSLPGYIPPPKCVEAAPRSGSARSVAVSDAFISGYN